MAYKRLIPCIFIAEGKAVRWFNDKSTLSDDVVGLAKYYSDYINMRTHKFLKRDLML